MTKIQKIQTINYKFNKIIVTYLISMTKHAQLTAQKREIVGSRVKTLRRQNITPAVVYSKTVTSTPIQVQTREFVKLYKQAGGTEVIDLMLDGKKIPVLIHNIDLHPYKRTLRHVDFLAVNLKEKMKAMVPVSVTGDAPGVKELGAVLSVLVDEIEVEALPDNIPEEIVVDVSALITFDDAIRISDLAKSKEYKITEDEDMLVANLTQQSEEEETQTPETDVAGSTDSDTSKNE